MTKIAKLLTFPLLVCIALGYSSCSSDPPVEKDEEFDVENKSFLFSTAEQSDVIKVTAVEVDWEAEVDEAYKSWLSINANKSDGNVTVYVTENKDPKEREGEFVITPNSDKFEPVTVKVQQSGVLSLVLSTYELEFDALDDTPQYIEVVVSEGVAWSIRDADNWISASKDGSRIKVSTSNNTSVNEVTGSFRVVTDNDDIEPKEVTVIMSGKPELSAAKTEVLFTLNNDQREEIEITAHNVDWTVSIENQAPWLKATRKDNKLVLEVVEANETGNQRKGMVVLYPDDKRIENVTVEVTQRGRPVLEVDMFTVDFEHSNNEPVVISVNLSDSGADVELDWDIRYDERLTWISIVPDFVENTITLTVEDNEVGEIRDIELIVFDKDEKLDNAEITITQANRINMIATQMVGILMEPQSEEMLNAYGFQLALGMGNNGDLTVYNNTELRFGSDSGTIMNMRLTNSDFTGDRLAPRMKAGTYNVADSGNQDMGLNAWSGGKVRVDPYTNETVENNTRMTEGTITVTYSGTNNVRVDIDVIMADGKPFVGYYDGPMPVLGANFSNPWNTYKRNITLPTFNRAVAINKERGYSRQPRIDSHDIWHVYLLNGDVEVTPSDEADAFSGSGQVLRIAVATPRDQPSTTIPTGTFDVAESPWDLDEGAGRDKTWIFGGMYHSSGNRGAWYFETSPASWRALNEFPLLGGTVTINGSGGNYNIVIDANDFYYSEVEQMWGTSSYFGVADELYTIKGNYSGSINVM